MKNLNFIMIGLLLIIPFFGLSQIKGIAFEAPSREIGLDEFQNMSAVHANWVCLMPYAYTTEKKSSIYFDQNNYQWWGERYAGTKECIRMAHESGLKIMLKPHLWISHGKFTGDHGFDNEEDWKIWETDYLKYIETYAKLAQEEKVELFCIGTELRTWFTERPAAWQKIINAVKKIYSGKLTYAGNWDSYKNFPYWDQLDYIGVDAYFPLDTAAEPEVDNLVNQWNSWKKELELLSKHYNKKILLTEYGYRNIKHTAKRPWESYTQVEESQTAQANAYAAIYKSLWGEKWMAGGFMWKWVCAAHLPRKKSTSYSPQRKKAFKVLSDFYAQ